MGRILCVANQKGGVGKTTTAINLAVGLAMAGRRTLLIDLDPQCNATSGLGQTPAARHPLLLPLPLGQSLCETTTPGLQLLPGSRSFQDVEALSQGRLDRPADETVEDHKIVGSFHRVDHSTTLRQHLSSGLNAFDFVLIDCPPSLGQLTRLALASASEVLMPIQCEYFAMEGLSQMIEVIREVMDQNDGRLQFGGILLTMYDYKLELTHEVEREVREFFGDIVYQSVIPRDVAVCEAPSHGLSVLEYAPRTRGARGYVELCREVLEAA